MEDIIDIIVTETTNTIEITAQPNDEIIDVNIIDNREDITLNVTPTVVEININSLTGNFGILWGEIEGTLSNQTDLNNALALKANLVGGKVPASELPSYVDDVVEVATFSALPATGEIGKIYVILDTNKIYRWSGSTYVEIADSTAVWGAITGTLSNQTDLQNALNAKLNVTTAASTYVPYTGATAHVNLGLNNFDANQINGLQIVAKLNGTGSSPLVLKTGTSGYSYGNDSISLISSPTSANTLMVISDVSSVTKIAEFAFGSLTTTRTFTIPDASGTVALTSQLHNAVTIGTANGLSLSTQVLSLGLASSSANGALSSSDWTTFNNKIGGSGVTDYYARFTGTRVVSDGFIRTTSNITYVEGMGLSSLNGLDITGNYGGGGGGLKIRSNDETTGNAYIDFANTGGRMYLGLNRSTASGLMTNATAYATVLTTGLGISNLEFGTNATKRMTIDGSSGAVTLTSTLTATGATLTGALNGTSATFSGDVTTSGSGFQGRYSRIFEASAQRGGLYPYNVISGGGTDYSIGLFSESSMWFAAGGGITKHLNIASTGAATFSSSVSATSVALNGSIANSADAATLTIKQTSTSYNNGIYLERGGERNGYHMYIGGALDSLTFRRNYFGTQSDVMSLTRDGNVGIGTTSPTTYSLAGRHLELNDAGGGYVFIHNNTTNVKSFFAADNADGSAGLYTFSNHFLKFGTNNTERMRITSAGNVGIGVTSTGDKLEVFSGASRAVQKFSTSTNGLYTTYASAAGAAGYIGNGQGILSTGIESDFAIRSEAALLFAAGGNTERMRLTSGGDLLVGTSTAQFASSGRRVLEVNGTSQALIALKTGDVSRGYIYHTGSNFETYNGVGNFYVQCQTNGVYLAPNATSWTANSDIRLKNVNSEITDALGKLSSLRAINYSWKSDSTNKENIGLIAQEVSEVLPQLIDTNKDGFLGVRYSELVPVLVQAVKELKAELDTLKNK